jgi:L,D-transpeptidase-like protein
LSRRLISVLGATVLSLAALPWAAQSAPVRTNRTVVGNVQASELGGISPDVLSLALRAVQCGVASGDLQAPPTLTVIDYSRPSVEPRLWVYDLKTGTLLFKELVAHGRNTGENIATRFSDAMNSHQSSLGLFVTSDTYVGNNGYSLRLDGLEPGVNARARERAIVMHGAPYVDAKMAASQGRLGRSWGCPALREAVARDVINTIRGGGVIFSYYPDAHWLTTSRFLNGCGSAATALATS